MSFPSLLFSIKSLDSLNSPPILPRVSFVPHLPAPSRLLNNKIFFDQNKILTLIEMSEERINVVLGINVPTLEEG